MENKKSAEFILLEKKCQYYITEYEAYKIKYESLNKEYERVLENNKKLYENINHERKLRKELEEKSKYSNLAYNNENDNNINKKGNNFQDEFVILEKEVETGEEELFNICNDSRIKHVEIIKNISFSIFSKNVSNNIINDEEKQQNEKKKIIKLNNNCNNNNQVKYNNSEPQMELVTEDIITQDFIKYSKESISLFNSIYEKELKIDKIYFFLQKFCHYLKILKKGADFFNKSLMLFNRHYLYITLKIKIYLKIGLFFLILFL